MKTKSVNDIFNQANRLMSVCNAKRNIKSSEMIRKISFRYFDNIRTCGSNFNSNDDKEYDKQYSRSQYMNETSAICPLDFDTLHDAYNYAMAHRFDETPLAVAIPTDVHGTDYGRSLAINGVKLFGVWSDALDSTANGYVYTTEAGAIEAMKQIEEDDKEAGIYEPDYYTVIDMTKYFA